MNSSITEFVDAHCHIDLLPDPQKAVNEAAEQRIHVIAVTNAPSVFFYTHALAKDSEYVHAAIGLHPELVKTHSNELESLWQQLALTRFVGEIGLDFVTTNSEERKLQIQVFNEILKRSADSKDKILTIHSRRAAKDVIQMIGPNFPGSIILHWYSGSKRDLEKAIQNGYYFSVNTSMISSKSGCEAISLIPHDRLLTETDAPFVRWKGAQTSPSSVRGAAKGVAEIWKVDVAIAAHQISNNFDECIASRVSDSAK
ncbi:TatD family hydrolase [Lacunimicrobium album]